MNLISHSFPDGDESQISSGFLIDILNKEEDVTSMENLVWTIYMDEASGAWGFGIIVVFISLLCVILSQAIKISFSVTNNKAEYEALVDGLRFVFGVSFKHLRVYSGLELVVNQVLRISKVRDEILQKYVYKAKAEISKFENFKIKHILRDKN